jgi:hypothetical protein
MKKPFNTVISLAFTPLILTVGQVSVGCNEKDAGLS